MAIPYGIEAMHLDERVLWKLHPYGENPAYD